jgi:hypothetical protein
VQDDDKAPKEGKNEDRKFLKTKIMKLLKDKRKTCGKKVKSRE